MRFNSYNPKDFLIDIIIKILDIITNRLPIQKINFFKEFLQILKSKIIFIGGRNSWAVYWIGENIVENLNRIGLKASSNTRSFYAKNKIIHWGAINYFIGSLNSRQLRLDKNFNVVNWYHVIKDDYRLKFIHILKKKLDYIITPSNKTKKTLVKHGFDENRVKVIPLGVDLNHFRQFDENTRSNLKKKYNLPEKKKIIGSFQKDGVGWGEGLTPKLVKGPDIFCDIVKRMKEKIDLHVFLTGPARGYVKNKLDEFKIPYTHIFFENYLDLVECYNVLDLYLVTSRIEGGPLSLIEGMATGIPIVTTNVGMADYVIKHGHNGYIADVENPDQIFKFAMELLTNKELRDKFIINGQEEVKKYDWANIAKLTYNKVYKKLLH